MTKGLFTASPPMIPSNTTDFITAGRKYGLFIGRTVSRLFYSILCISDIVKATWYQTGFGIHIMVQLMYYVLKEHPIFVIATFVFQL